MSVQVTNERGVIGTIKVHALNRATQWPLCGSRTGDDPAWSNDPGEVDCKRCLARLALPLPGLPQ